MPQLVKENGLLSIVDKDVYTFGEAKGTEVIEFEFEYKGSVSSIEYIETTCPCIKAWYEDKKIKGTLDLKKVQKGPFQPGTETSIGKNLKVFINDGVNRYTANDKKQVQPHPLKRWFSLQVAGKVVA